MSSIRNKLSRGRSSKRSMSSDNNPKNFDSNPIFTKTFRYQAQSSEGKGADVVSARSICNLMYVGVAGTTGKQIFSAVKLHSVEVFSPPVAATSTTENYAFTNISLEWEGDRCSAKTILATGSINKPARIKSKPPRGSFAEMWFNPSNTTYNPPLFNVDSQLGAIMEIKVSFCLLDIDNVELTSSISMASSTGTGVLYYNTVDNTAIYNFGGSPTIGTNNWAPLGVNQSISGFG